MKQVSFAPSSSAPLPAGTHILVVEARYYSEIADHLLNGVRLALEEAGVTFDIVTVPGALEIPAAIVMCLEARDRHYDAAIALGCVIRGETSHYDLVSNESARALMDISIQRGIGIGNGILTVENEGQALERADPSRLNKGGFAAEAALSLVRLKKSLTG